MVGIRITLRELNLLVKYYKNLKSEKKVLITFDEKEIDTIVDRLSECFTLKGLKKNYEPNSVGNELELLIDKFVSAQQDSEDKN